MWVRGHLRSLKMVPFESWVRFPTFHSNYGRIFNHFGDIQCQWPDLEIWVRSRSRSLKMVPFDGTCTTFYRSAIVTIAVSCTVFELFDIKYYRDLEIRVRGHSRSTCGLVITAFPARYRWPPTRRGVSEHSVNQYFALVRLV